MLVIRPGSLITFSYTNHAGRTEERRAIFQGMDYGENSWYTTPQWLMRTLDLDRMDYRSFALALIDMSTFKIAKA